MDTGTGTGTNASLLNALIEQNSGSLALHVTRSIQDPASPTWCHNPSIDRRAFVDASRAPQGSGEFEQQGFQWRNCTHLLFFFFMQTAPCVHAITCRCFSSLPRWTNDRQRSHVVLRGNLKITGICVITPRQHVQTFCFPIIRPNPERATSPRHLRQI